MDLEPWRQAWRTAETAAASTVHHPFGKPGGPGLWHTGKELPAYIQNVAHAFRRKGMPESEAISQAVGVVRNWAEGHDGHGHKVHPDVQAAAAKAIAEWEKLRAEAHATGGSKRSADPATMVWQRAFGQRADPFHVPAGHAGGGQFTSASGGGGSSAAKHGAGKPRSTPVPAAHTATAKPPKETAAELQRRHRLLAQAHADRQQARQLETQLHTLEGQQRASATAAKKSAATAKAAAKAGKPAAHRRHTAAHHHHASHARSLKQRISALQGRITSLRQQASALEARARAV